MFFKISFYPIEMEEDDLTVLLFKYINCQYLQEPVQLRNVSSLYCLYLINKKTTTWLFRKSCKMFARPCC